MPHAPNPRDTFQCKFVKTSGHRCKKNTSFSTGYCEQHTRMLKSKTEVPYLKCSECHIREKCLYFKNGGVDACYFEQYDPVRNWESKSVVADGMKRILNLEMRMIHRLELEFENPLRKKKPSSAELKWLIDSAQNHMFQYAKFMGWDGEDRKPPLSREKEKKISKIFKSGKEDEGKIIRIEVGNAEERTQDDEGQLEQSDSYRPSAESNQGN